MEEMAETEIVETVQNRLAFIPMRYQAVTILANR